MGGLVALSAVEAGLRPRSLTLVASQPRMIVGDDWPHAIGSSAFKEFRRRARLDRDSAMRYFTSLVAHGDAQARRIRDQLQGAPVPDQMVLERGLNLLERADLRGPWVRCQSPRQCILGENDALVPAEAVESLRALCPEARLDLIPDSGHALPLSQPDRCAELMREFWRSLE